MRKYSSQVLVALVCCLLGFMIAYQFKIINIRNKNDVQDSTNSTDVTLEIEQLNTQKKELQAKVDELQTKIKNYEKDAASDSDKQLLSELNSSRMLSGEEDVKGSGIVINITPQTGILNNNTNQQPITASDLVKIVNTLNGAGAEAISVNDIRITSRTGIRDAGNAILVNDDRISPWKVIVIKAIGDKKAFSATESFPGDYPEEDTYRITFQPSDSIQISACTDVWKFNYAKPADKK